MSHRISLVCLAIGAIFVAVPGARGQSRATTGDLVGLVQDASMAVVPGAMVRVIETSTNLVRATVTQANGRFFVAALSPSVYTVEVDAPGFALQVRRGVTMSLGAVVELTITVEVARVEADVSVIGQSPLVDTRRTVLSTVVPQSLINSLPIDGRNFISFSVITPGVSIDRTPQQGAASTSGLTFAGQRGRSNNITVDGLDNNDTITGGVRAAFSQEAVQEFQVLAGSFSAEFGKASGGVVNIVTKGGANQPAGSAFFFGRNDHLNAKEYFERFDVAGQPVDREKAPYGQKQFGATFGGPARLDKTFYFLSFERLDIHANNFVNIDDSTPVFVFGRPMGTAVDILRRAGFPVETGHVPYDVNSREFLSKVDHRIGAAQGLSVRFNWASTFNENSEPWGGQIARSRGALLDSNDWILAASHMWVRSSAAVNEFRSQIADRDQSVLSLDPTCGGVCEREDQGGPTIEIPGVASAGRQRFTPQPRKNIRYQVLDTFSYFRTDHHFKAGVDYNYIDHRSGSLPLHFGGRYIFAPLPAIPGLLPAPVSSVQALALGLPAAYVQGYGNAAAQYGYQDISLFAQDDWSPTRDLTIKLGVRYQKQFWPSSSQYTVRGVGLYAFPSDNDNVAPRVAVAWNPWHDKGRTFLHGAYGVFYDNQLTNLVGVSDILNGSQTGVRTLVLRFPASVQAWNAPGRRLSEPSSAYPSLKFVPDPSLTTPYAHHLSAGINHELPGQLSLAANFTYVRGKNEVGTLDYNPLVPALGPGRRPEDVVDPVLGPLPGTSASVLQTTAFGETWYRGLTVSLGKRVGARHQFLVSYTLSKAEDTSTDFQSSSIPQNTGQGRDPLNPTGLPIGFNPNDEKGPAVQDQRHRFVLSGLYVMPREIQISSIVTVASGRPYNVLAGADLDGNGDGGSFPADRARRTPSDPATSVTRNVGTMPAQAEVDLRVSRKFRLAGRASVDAMFEVFNLFNRTNFTEIDGVFGTGAYPTNPLLTFGQFQQAGPPRQIQLAARLTF